MRINVGRPLSVVALERAAQLQKGGNDIQFEVRVPLEKIIRSGSDGGMKELLELEIVEENEEFVLDVTSYTAIGGATLENEPGTVDLLVTGNLYRL